MAKETEWQSVDPGTAVEALRAALDRVEIVLPSLAVDTTTTPDLGLVELGRVRADVAVRLARVLHQAEPAA